MYDNEFFVVDLASCSSTGEIINSLMIALETLEQSGKKIILKMNSAVLNQSQLLSIQSLVTSYGCILYTIQTASDETAKIAKNMNILVEEVPEIANVETENINKQIEFTPFAVNMESNIQEIPADTVEEHAFQSDINDINNIREEQQIEENILDNIETPDISSLIPSDDIQSIQNVDFRPVNLINEETEEIAETVHMSDELQNAEKNSIGVYKKAYVEEEVIEDEFEEVDFYETQVNESIVLDSKITTYVNQTLRSGQILESEGNVVIIGDCHPGSEIRAAGDVTVWGILSGIAHAGNKGNKNAKIRALKLNAVQLRIANCYARRPDGTNIPYVIKTSVFTPEEARVVDDEIMLYKINQN